MENTNIKNDEDRYVRQYCNTGVYFQPEIKKLYSVEKLDFATKQLNDDSLKQFYSDIDKPHSQFLLENDVLKRKKSCD